MRKLSIITINLNNLEGLKKTMQSVFEQTFTEYEYIIIDGGSTDGSTKYIEQHEDKLVCSVSEKDGGVYEAMNKGIRKASGEYCLFLNSGDYLVTKYVLQYAMKFNFAESIVYCDVKNNLTGKVIEFPEKLNFSQFYYASINHQCTFIKRDLFARYGLYNEENKIVSDWEFFIKCIFLHNESTRHLRMVLSEFDFSAGLGTSDQYSEVLKEERQAVFEKFFSGFIDDYQNLERWERAYKGRVRESIKLNKGLVTKIRKARKFLKLGIR